MDLLIATVLLQYKAVYRNVINDEQKKFTDKINSHFTTMQHEMQHEKEKTP